jgi:hypothetical protein
MVSLEAEKVFMGKNYKSYDKELKRLQNII